MMYLTAANEDVYAVSFNYRKDKEGRRVTQCEVYKKHTEPEHIELIGVGRATCSKSDNFNRVVGRKLALAEAVANLDKDVRSDIWGAYKAKCNFIP